MGVGEFSSIGSQLVDVRCLEFGRTVAAEVTIAEVVGKYQNDVRELGALKGKE